MSRDVSLPVAAQRSVEDVVGLAERAEAAGYDRVWLPETWGRDAVSVLAAIAGRTEAIGVGTSVLPVYSRSPALLGQTAATLQELSDGRFRLGLGPSGPMVVEHWHGVPYEAPLRRTRETLEVVRAVCSGEVVDYDGEHVQLAGFRLRCAPPAPTPPIDVSGMGPTAVELAGRFADGWHALMLTRDGMADRLADLRRGADLGDRARDDVRVMRTLGCAALPDGERARRLAREHLAFYVGGMGAFYRDSLARQGWGDAADEIAEAYLAGERDAAVAAVPDELVDELSATGTPEAASAGLERWEAMDGVDAVSISFPRGARLEEIHATMDALAP